MVLLLTSCIVQGQAIKPALWWEMIDKADWSGNHFASLGISDNGQNVVYKQGANWILQATETWEKIIFKNTQSLRFIPGTDDLLEFSNDSLKVCNTTGKIIRAYSHINYFNASIISGRGSVLIAL